MQLCCGKIKKKVLALKLIISECLFHVIIKFYLSYAVSCNLEIPPASSSLCNLQAEAIRGIRDY